MVGHHARQSVAHGQVAELWILGCGSGKSSPDTKAAPPPGERRRLT